MRGVLSVLGMDQASQALLRMRDEVDGLVSTEVDPAKVAQAGVFDRIAGNLSALGFMIDMLSVQPQLAKSLFVFDADEGHARAGDGPRRSRQAGARPSRAPVEPRLIEAAQMLAFSSVREDVPLQEVTLELERLSHEAQAADQPTLAAAVLKAQEAILSAADDPVKVTTARGELSEALVDFVATATEPAGLEVISEPAPLAPMKPIALVGDLEHDDEMRDVFLEEAREVIEGAQAACAQLQHAPGDLGLLTTVRRAFHTLKGSGRMVGLKSFGEAAWACEQVFNTQLAEQRAAEPPLIEFATWVLGHLSALGRGHRRASRRRAQRGRGQGRRRPGRPPPRHRRGQLRHRPADRPARRTCRAPPISSSAAAAPAPAEAAGVRPTEVAFELDLSGLRRAPTSAAAPIGELPALDDASSAMFDPLRRRARRAAAADQARTTIVDAPFDMTSGPIDLDLGVPTDAAPLIELLEPSDTASPPAPDLLLDLSERRSAARRGADLGLAADAAGPGPVAAAEPAAAPPTGSQRRPSRRSRSMSRSSGRCGSASRSSTST